MGNLIIKGKGGAGNKLILQDQAGAAVLTTADSGATIANATLNSNVIHTGGGGLKSMQVITSTATWTRPANITRIKVYVTGGGGGGFDAGADPFASIAPSASGGMMDNDARPFC